MEKESRVWFIQCSEYGFEKSVWDAGNSKSKAICARFGRQNWHSIYRKEEKI
ncbi:MAG TPA: hypothetical protein PKY82_02850 [Pyrinomonadaceae bacterium]|nr:hypothetical protein [Pyrinomonadaceae bacterium]